MQLKIPSYFKSLLQKTQEWMGTQKTWQLNQLGPRQSPTFLKNDAYYWDLSGFGLVQVMFLTMDWGLKVTTKIHF